MIEENINKLKGRIVSFSYHVENMVNTSIKGLLEQDNKILNEVIDVLEKEANKFDTTIEKECIATIAQFSPKASNLRLLLMILKMNKDLERMADHCVNISHNSKDILHKGFTKQKFYDLIDEMANEVKKMLKNSIESFINEDSDLAKSVCKRDEKVNKYKTDLTKFFIEKMKKNPDLVDCSINFIEIVNNLERIADLSTNISEDVVFIFQGKVIKH